MSLVSNSIQICIEIGEDIQLQVGWQHLQRGEEEQERCSIIVRGSGQSGDERGEGGQRGAHLPQGRCTSDIHKNFDIFGPPPPIATPFLHASNQGVILMISGHLAKGCNKRLRILCAFWPLTVYQE